MEKRLANYRAENSKLERAKKTKQKIKSLFTFFQGNTQQDECMQEQSSEEYDQLLDEAKSETSASSDFDNNTNCCTTTPMEKLFYYFLLFVIWATLYAIFVMYQFGTVYFIMSALMGICFNTRTSPKRPGEVSAYSVFNKNCESIDGTLKAEQFEKELRYSR